MATSFAAESSWDVPIAHTARECGELRLQALDDHLHAVARLAADFGQAFKADEWAAIAGLWHDVGKYSSAFQEYLARASSPDSHVADAATKTDHSTAGAQHAVARAGILGHLLAFVIAGHHSGLLDSISEGACLDARLGKDVEPWNSAPIAITDRPTPQLPAFVRRALGSKDAFSVSFFTRMIFSCLVDADFLDTEAFIDPERGGRRPNWPDNVFGQMESALDAYISALGSEQCAGPSGTESSHAEVQTARAEVREACLAAAEKPPGLFSLTVPTGGGKTLSSLAFALRHARYHDLQRIIYVIPFTSIIEQNAAVFRAVMRTSGIASESVLEHHSNLDVGKETLSSRLAAENWDAPLIVTTSVQFYESLFANRTSRCRKLHRLARAVIILDEAQDIPVDYLEPCLRALEELVTNYGSTVVLCTATQPAIRRRDDFRMGLEGVREIIPDSRSLYRNLKRAEVTSLGSLDDESLAERILGHDQVLCIVNTRRHARVLFEAIGSEDGHYHLSALMCGAHRTEVLRNICRALDEERACRVVSTQLIEAGVDVDFPTVYRSMAGIDSIAQAAGRCNREGRVRIGMTYAFDSEHTASERFFAETTNCGRQVLALHDDPLSLDAVEHYFRLYYWEQSDRWDSKQILQEFRLNQDRSLPFLFGFSTVARDFRFIDDYGQPVIIPWRDKGERLRSELLARGDAPSRDLLRRLQRYTVHVPRRVWDEHVGRSIELIHDRYPVLANPALHYSEKTGLTLGIESADFLAI